MEYGATLLLIHPDLDAIKVADAFPNGVSAETDGTQIINEETFIQVISMIIRTSRKGHCIILPANYARRKLFHENNIDYYVITPTANMQKIIGSDDSLFKYYSYDMSCDMYAKGIYTYEKKESYPKDVFKVILESINGKLKLEPSFICNRRYDIR